MKKRIRCTFHDAPVSMEQPGPGDNPEQDRELVAELDGIGYVLVTGTDNKTRIYRTAPPEVQNGRRTRDQEAEGWGVVMQRLERIEQALRILAQGDDDPDNPENEESLEEQFTNGETQDRRRRRTGDTLFQPDRRLGDINASNRRKHGYDTKH